MSIENKSTVDAIGIDNATGSVILTLIDHLDWDDEREHLLLLQNKLNTYLAFIESGELLAAYPGAIGRPVVIDVVSRCPQPCAAKDFLDRSATVIRAAGYELRVRTLGEGPGA